MVAFNAFSGTLLFLSLVLTVFHMVNAAAYIFRKPAYMRKQAIIQKEISLLIPCYNEQSIIQTAIMGVQRLDYPNLEVIYVNDGSTDDTMNLLFSQLKLKSCTRMPANKLSYELVRGFYQSTLYPHIYVLDKNNGGKADSLNAASDYASMELVATLDADSILDQHALHVINRVFHNQDVIAVGGMVHILQGRSAEQRLSKVSLKLKHIVRFQIIEYLKGFYIYKASLAHLDALTIISGAFGVFNKQVLFEVGGYRKSLGEDIDITLRFQNYIMKNKGKRMLFVPEAVCYTECPEGWGDLFRQRVRWQKAFIDCIVNFRGTLLTTFLFRSVSFFFLIDAFLVGTIAAYFAITSIVVLLLSSSANIQDAMITYVAISFAANVIYSGLALLVARHYGTYFKGMNTLRLINTVLFDLLIFRYITMFFVMYGSLSYLFNRHDWNKVTRTGREYQLDQAG